MARITSKPRSAPCVMGTALALVMVGTGAASASDSIASSVSGTPTCQADNLRISVPIAVPGDPAEGMGKQAWNVFFRDDGGTACSLRGWPQVMVHTSSGKTMASRISDVLYSNLAIVPDAKIVLQPGHSAVVTAMSPTAERGCTTKWTLGLTLPGSERPVTVREPAGSFVPCLGGQLRLSPFYAEQTLTREIKALKVSAAPPPFRATTRAEPPACKTGALRAHVASSASGTGGSIIELQLSNAGGTCVLPESWPTVRVRTAGDAPTVAKILANASAIQAERSLLTTYEHGTTQKTALALRRGGSVDVDLVAAGSGAQACRRVTSVTIYPSAGAVGAGRSVDVAAPVSICGSPRILSFLPDREGGTAMTIAHGALHAIRADPAAAKAGGDSPGFYYGTDSAAPSACGHGPYTEPEGDCGSGTDGPYGEYIGELGAFWNWKACTSSGLAWDQGNYNMANDNLVDYHTGLGSAAYWFAAGPGRDPHYNGTTAEAQAWGQQQAQALITRLNGSFFGFRYIFMDIENNGAPPDGNGWNTVWNGPCGNTVKATYISAQVDYATYQGFASYIDAHTPYLAGVYSAGGVSYGSWTGIFGGEQFSHAAEWTFTNEQSELSFPGGFSDSSASPQWFAGAPAACHLLWQWSGGNGVVNGYGDFDQAQTSNNANPSC
jgi:Protein of unknown function (DUF4232)